MDAAAQLPEHLRGEFVQAIEEMQVRDQMKMYNRLSEHCFRDCVDSFHGKALTGSEEKCVVHCAKKFLNMTRRVGQRFQEINVQQQQEQQLAMSQ